MSEVGEAAKGRLARVLRARRATIKRLRDKGIEPFALRFDKGGDAAELHAKFDYLGAGEEGGHRAAVAGRVILLRKHGKVSFITLRDATGDLQLFLTDESLKDD